MQAIGGISSVRFADPRSASPAFSFSSRIQRACGLLLVLLTLAPMPSLAKDFRVCLAELPGLSQASNHGGHGILVDMVKAMRAHYRAGNILIEITPLARSFKILENGGCDIHLPMLNNPEAPFQEANLRLEKDVIFKVPFVVYSRADRPPLEIGMNPRLRLETDQALIRDFPFPVAGTTCLACSLKKVRLDRIDGVIFAAKEMNILIREENLTGLRATLYRQFDVHPVVRKGPQGDEAERLFHQLLGKLKETGEYFVIMHPLINYDWRQ